MSHQAAKQFPELQDIYQSSCHFRNKGVDNNFSLFVVLEIWNCLEEMWSHKNRNQRYVSLKWNIITHRCNISCEKPECILISLSVWRMWYGRGWYYRGFTHFGNSRHYWRSGHKWIRVKTGGINTIRTSYKEAGNAQTVSNSLRPFSSKS